MSSRIGAGFLIAAFTCLGCQSESHVNVSDLIPSPDELDDWQIQQDPVTVSDEEGLYSQIPGDAFAYLDRGWKEAVFLLYAKETVYLSIAIHDMGEPNNAKDILDYLRGEAQETLWTTEDSTALLDNGRLAAYGILMQVGRFFVELGIGEKEDDSKSFLIEVAQHIRDRA